MGRALSLRIKLGAVHGRSWRFWPGALSITYSHSVPFPLMSVCSQLTGAACVHPAFYCSIKHDVGQHSLSASIGVHPAIA
jgi:hypothetical protein